MLAAPFLLLLLNTLPFTPLAAADQEARPDFDVGDLQLAPPLVGGPRGGVNAKEKRQDLSHLLVARQYTCDAGERICPCESPFPSPALPRRAILTLSLDGCCPYSKYCCNSANYCVTPGGECCSRGQGTCEPGEKCCGYSDRGCIPEDGECCSTGDYCPSGYMCVTYLGQHGCCTDTSLRVCLRGDGTITTRGSNTYTRTTDTYETEDSQTTAAAATGGESYTYGYTYTYTYTFWW